MLFVMTKVHIHHFGLFFKKNIYSIVEPFENYENFKHFFKT